MSTLYNLSPISTFTRNMTVCKYTFMGFHNAMRIFLLIAMTWAFTSMKAQNTVKIKGTVNDAGGSPISMVVVKVENQAAGTLTDLKGNYSFTFQSRDSVVITYSMLGYRTLRRVLLSPRDSVTLKVTMHLNDKVLNDAVVKGRRVQTNTMQDIKAESAKQLPSTTGNAVEDLISTMAGVSRHDEMSSQYNVRGGSFDENIVYLNGQEVFRPMLVRSGQQEGLSIINSNMVEKINFSTGGFEAKYGDKMSSVLDITYKKPKKFEASANGSLLGGGAYVGYGNEKFSVMSSIRYKTTRYLLGSLETTGEYRPNFLDYQAYLSWTPNERWAFDFIGNISDNHYNFKPESRETKFGTINDAKTFKVYFDGKEKDLFRTYYGAFTATRKFGKNTELSLLGSAFSTHEQETYDITGEYWLNESGSQEELGVGVYREHARNYLDAKVASAALRFKTRFGAHNLEAAVSLRTEHVEEKATEWEMRDSSGYSIPHNPNELQLFYNMHANERINTTRIEAYVQDTYRFSNKLGHFTLNYGIRMSNWSWNKETIISPRASIGLIPDFNDNWVFRFATGVYYQTPFYKELRDTVTTGSNTVVRLNREIKSQRSIQFVLGGDYNFKLDNRPFRFTTEIYYKAMSNLIPYNINNVRTIYYGRNISDGYAVGIDTKLYGEFVPGTDSWVTFSLMRTKEKIGNKWVPRPTDQRYNISLYFTDFFPGTDRWKLTLRGALADGLPFGPPHSGREKQNFRAPAYKRVDIGMSYRLLNNEDGSHTRGIAKILRNAWLGIDAFNVFGINNVNSYYWVSDVTNQQYAVPNYLTGRLINLNLQLEF